MSSMDSRDSTSNRLLPADSSSFAHQQLVIADFRVFEESLHR